MRVSRFHATVEFHDGEFVLRDHSTNGCLLEFGTEANARPLRRSATVLHGRGAVRLGRTSVNDEHDTPGLRFEIA